ncbi:MAG: DUF2911 domain-containing protein [Terriglobia bacterium]|nr:DUF2911 domain-containing protein [Terriglobia bacterium]
MKFLASVLTIAASVALMPVGLAQMSGSLARKQPLSPPAKTTVQLNGKEVSITYNTPSMRGRKIFGDLVPYDKVWRTGANAATTLKTETNLKIGTATVPAGTYTLFTIPSESTWKLIINKQTGQWGLDYEEAQDLARVEMRKDTLPQPQEKMSISFENTHSSTTQLHVRWDTTDVWVPVVAQ